jgi:predicted dehydrogenase
MHVGLIGFGVIGRQYLEYFKKKNYKVIIFDTKFKNKKKITNNIILTTSKNEIFKSKEIQNIFITSYDSTHFNFLILGIKFKKNIFVEKPMCVSLEELGKIYENCKKNKFKNLIMSNYVLNTSLLFKWLQNKISKNFFFKDIYFIEASYLWARLYKLTNGWRRLDKNYSIMKGGGIHLISLVYFLIKKLPYKLISFSNNLATKKNKLKIQDFELANFFYKNGLIVKVDAHSANVTNHQHVLKIFSNKKTFILDDSGARIFNKREGNSIKIKINKLYKNKTDLINYFINAKKTAYKKIILDELNVMSICLHASKYKNKFIKIKYFNDKKKY